MSRLLYGGFRSRGALEDALLVALIETGVPVWALDADLVDPGGLGIRATVDGDRFGSGEQGHGVPPDRLVVADPSCIHAMLFGRWPRAIEPDRAHDASPCSLWEWRACLRFT